MLKKILKLNLLFTAFLTILSAGAQTTSNYNQIIVGANNNGAIFSANLDGSNPSQIGNKSNYFSFYGAVDSPSESKIYVAWYYGVYAMDYKGNNFQTLYSFPEGGLGGAIDIDINNNDVYFISTPEKKLYKMKTDGSGLTVISNTRGYGTDLVLDTDNSYIYYFDNKLSSKGLFKMHMDGTGLETLLTNTDKVYNFNIDFANSKIYYCSSDKGYVCNLDGSNSTTLFNFQIGDIAIDNNTNLLYLTDITNKSIKTANLDGSNIQTIIESTDIYFFDIDEDVIVPLDNPSGIVLINNKTLGINDVKPSTDVVLSPNPSNKFYSTFKIY